MIPYGRHYIDSKDIEAVVRVLKSGRITQGGKIREFEKRLASWCQAKYAVVVSSGTAGLHLACLAAGIKKGDEVIASPLSFVASTNCILYCQARPVFCDIQQNSANIDPKQIKKKINQKTKAIIPVHFAGYPCDMGEIHKIAKANNLIVIEDACHALGAQYKIGNKWYKIGGSKHSDMAVVSFHPVKTITTGEGGVVLTNNKKFYEKLVLLRHHGITKDSSRFMDKRASISGKWYYEMQDLGFNYRITDFQCAFGLSQLKKINQFIKAREEISQRYNKAFKGLHDSIKIPICESNDKKHAWHLYVLNLRLKNLAKGRRHIFNLLRSKGIGVQVHYLPVFLHPYYKLHYKIDLEDFPNTMEFFNSCLSLPIYPALKKEEQKYVIRNFKNLIEGLKR
ncbi:MAG: UDP-4-amino-4,6-dideoxy-N-acetyl-beta-L-altrosamine transaminase [Candidatus Omnitrophica bacterium]|nr:UDP-4-amino-4,6-dideoxy-N-acetyl-beta-L-altrosamine transaminase [Candidatus Omnitrophota bacterium]